VVGPTRYSSTTPLNGYPSLCGRAFCPPPLLAAGVNGKTVVDFPQDRRNLEGV